MSRLLIVAVLLLASAGCGNKLATGYEPRPLGASAAQRRGFYALPFSTEARAAEADRDSELDARRPRPGY